MNAVKRALNIVKLLTIVAFMVTLSATYYLRSEVLTLNKIRFSASNVRAEDDLRQMTESYPARLAEHEVESKHYRLQMDHYTRMLELYRTDYDEYVTRVKDKYAPPQLPWKPVKPESPELSDQLGRIDEFCLHDRALVPFDHECDRRVLERAFGVLRYDFQPYIEGNNQNESLA